MAQPVSLIVFGPQTPWPSEVQARLVRESILNDERLGDFRQAIEQLPRVWSDLVEEHQHLKRVPATESIRILQRWIRNGALEHEFDHVPNVLMTPLTVIIHIGLYFLYLNESGESHSRILERATSGAQGFCTGLLSAVSVASSASEVEVAKKAATALGVAMAIGAYVDLDGDYAEEKKEYVCLAARWKSGERRQHCEDIISRYLNTYISVDYDITSATITTLVSEKDILIKDLAEAGATVRPIELRGRFHTSHHQHAASELMQFCNSKNALQIGGAHALKVPVRTNFNAEPVSSGSLTDLIVSSLLLKHADWSSTIHAAVGSEERILAFGLSESVPSTICRRSGIEVQKVDGISAVAPSPYSYPDDAIAVVGMAAKYAGADSLDEFWDNIERGVSMVEKLPASRWNADELRRTSGRTFYGNFVHDADAFDHKLFKQSSRSAAAMDPQQRLLLQAAYRAVESAGYFSDPSPPQNIGVYVGVATQDYHDNIASHKPSAFSALGELRAFLCGRISHFFNWTGPSMTFDTACSASAVAIDAACKAIKAGTIPAALAGGVNVCSSPYLWENLMGANFISPTGQSKPFDAKGDGYCRGEGVGLVFLKKLSLAQKDGDQILGVIAGSAVNQCMNDTFITVPNGRSQLDLYREVIGQSGIAPEAITYVEAHGPGTQAGDPVEISSIREVIGTPKRKETVAIGSTKGNIGHTEAASGVASVMKTVLMMQKSLVPLLASHQTLNPKIPPLEANKMYIPRETIPWCAPFKAALINNYGAAGSNGALVVCQPPAKKKRSTALNKVPILLSAFSPQSLVQMGQAVQRRLRQLGSENESLTDAAFTLTDKYQHFAENSIAGTASSTSEAIDLLDSAKANCSVQSKPVVLVFGGQTRDHVGLDRQMYEKVELFRQHLDAADAAIQAAGFESVIPDIFQRSRVEDVVKLHCMFFAVQHACAKSWMDAGIKVEAVIGHSFGQLTALCISGRLSIADTIKIIGGRATLIKKLWGSENGSMISLMATAETAAKIVDLVASKSGKKHQVEIACFNGPTSHVLVGTRAAIDYVEQLLPAETAALGGTVKYRRLNVTHGFHSVFTDPLLPELASIAEGVTFQRGSIALETCSEEASWDEVTPQKIVEHTRTAVYFGAAVQRLADTLGPCTWLEAGGDSSVTAMVRAVFDADTRQRHTFHGLKMAGDDALDALADSTADLWKAGQKVKFWPFHRVQRKHFNSVTLPPYQFEKTRHWLEWREPSAPVAALPVKVDTAAAPELLTLVSKTDGEATFSVDPRCDEFQHLVRGHAVLDAPLCPADWYTEIAHRAYERLSTGNQSRTITGFKSLAFHAPLGIDQERQIALKMTRKNGACESWNFAFSSSTLAHPSKSTQHCTGEMTITLPHDTIVESEMVRYENLLDISKATSLLQDTNATGLRGMLLYDLFARVVNYADYYKSVKAVSAIGSEVAAQIVLPERSDLVIRKKLSGPIAVDNFVQVAGIKVNCLNPINPDQVYICGHIGRVQESKEFDPYTQNSWTVYAHSRKVSEKCYMNDIYVFAQNGKLAMIIQDVEFTRVAISTLTRVLAAANAESQSHTRGQKPAVAPIKPSLKRKTTDHPPPAIEVSAALEDAVDNQIKLRELISKVTDVPLESIKPESTFDDLGIDSLMNTEVLNAVQEEFDVKISLDQFMDLHDIRSLSKHLSPSSRSARSTKESSRYVSNSITQATTPDLDTSSESESRPSPAEPEIVGPQSDTFDQLSKLVSELLDITGAVSPEMALEELGMDSLLSIELTGAIEEKFKVQSDSIVVDGTLNQLYESVLKASGGAHLTVSLTPSTSGRKVNFKDVGTRARRIPGDRMKTVCFKEADGVQMMADIYLPDPSQVTAGVEKPIALMIHGGGHTMLSRKDIRPRQTQLLLENGFLPVSIDYRLCPEINIIDGAMTDVCDALEWCRTSLPKLDLGVTGLVLDSGKVAVVGWSTGGTLALTLGFNSLRKGIRPPDATLAFYCPSNYEDPFWKSPNYPEDSASLVPETYDLLEGVHDKPITGYNVDPKKRAVGGWCSMDDPRSRIVLHMNWKGQALPVLLNGLPNKKSLPAKADLSSYLSLPQPSDERIISISPRSQILKGNYKTPTFLIHSDIDDLVPLKQAEDTYNALKEKGVETGMSVVEGVPHLFDLYRDKKDERGWKAVREGYQFLVGKIFE